MLQLRHGYRNPDGTTGLRQGDAATLAGLTQSKVSRAERGTFTLKPEEARRYARALGATPAQVDRLVRLTEAIEPTTVAGQARLMRRGAEIQRRIHTLESQSELVRSWQPTIIPGSLQTWEYTVALIEFEPGDEWTLSRTRRVALIDDPDREFRFVISEAALRWVVGSTEVMRAQLAHLIELLERPNLSIAVLPFGQTAVPPPESSFHLYGTRAAIVSTDVGTTFLDDRKDIDTFTAVFDRLDAAALHGDDARALIRDIETQYRNHASADH